MPTLPSQLVITEAEECQISVAETAKSVAESVLIDVSSNDDSDLNTVISAPHVKATPSFIFTPCHLGTQIDAADSAAPVTPKLAPRVVSRATYESRYAIAAKRGAPDGFKPWSRAARLKKQRPASRWSFTLDSGLALEGVPLTHSGVSNLLDEMDLKVEAR